MTTRDQMIENAARLLTKREAANVRAYGGGDTSDALELARAWTDLAAITTTPSTDTPTPPLPVRQTHENHVQ